LLDYLPAVAGNLVSWPSVRHPGTGTRLLPYRSSHQHTLRWGHAVCLFSLHHPTPTADSWLQGLQQVLSLLFDIDQTTLPPVVTLRACLRLSPPGIHFWCSFLPGPA